MCQRIQAEVLEQLEISKKIAIGSLVTFDWSYRKEVNMARGDGVVKGAEYTPYPHTRVSHGATTPPLGLGTVLLGLLGFLDPSSDPLQGMSRWWVDTRPAHPYTGHQGHLCSS